jgi:hypothetical protein
MVVGWAAPDGAVLGLVPLPNAATARFGDDWLGFPWQGGMVWIRRSDWPTAPIAGLLDLTPPTPAPVVVWQPPAAPAAQSATHASARDARRTPAAADQGRAVSDAVRLTSTIPVHAARCCAALSLSSVAVLRRTAAT